MKLEFVHLFKNKLHITKKQKRVAIGIGVFLLVLIIPYVFIQAKYMLKTSAKSVSSASGFYFSSNKLSDITETATAEDNRAEYVINGWDGKTERNFEFVIRDYENPLLYNDSNQVVKYKITYTLEKKDENDDISDKVDITIKQGDRDITKDTVETIGNELGQTDKSNYNSKAYVLKITPKDSVTITQDLKVAINVEAQESPYPRKLGARVVLQYTSSTDYIAEKGFKTTSDKYIGENITDSDYALVYGIGTTYGSNMTNADANKAVKRLHYTWDYEKLGIDRFDNLNQEGFKTVKIGETYKDEEVTLYNMSKFTNVIILQEKKEAQENETQVNKKIGHLFFDTVPYSYYTIIMYKKDASITPEKAKSDEYADVEVVEEETGDSGSNEG